MATHEFAMLPQAPRDADKKIFRRRAILNLGKNSYSHARTIDISPHHLSLMVDAPLSIGHSGSLAFNITVNQKTMPQQLKGKVSYCVLVGTEGFRVGFSLTSRDDAQHKNQMQQIMSSLPF